MKLTQDIIDKIQEALLHTKKDGREEYMEQLKALDEQHMKDYAECVDHLVESMEEQKK